MCKLFRKYWQHMSSAKVWIYFSLCTKENALFCQQHLGPLVYPPGQTCFLPPFVSLTPHWQRKCYNKAVNDTCADRSSWQMLDSGPLAVTHDGHMLTHWLWESRYTESEKWQSSWLPPHLCFSFFCQPTSFSFLLSLVSVVLSAWWSH